MEQANATMTGGNDDPLETQGLCLLSLDGGGVRGLSTLYILKGLMDQLSAESPDGREVKPCEVFDLIGGTSTGGLIAIMLGRLELSVDECIEAYTDLMARVFKHSKLSPVSLTGNVRARFDSKELEKAIQEVIISRGGKETDKLNDGSKRGCKVFVCTVAHETKDVVRLRSYRSHKRTVDATILQAALATSAASSFFEPVQIGARKFVDGGLAVNNPVEEVKGEAADIWCRDTGDIKPLVKCFISIGTGNPGKKAIEDKMAKFLAGTLKDLATETEHTEKRFAADWRKHLDDGRYFRFNVDQGMQDIGLAEYQQQGAIEAATDGYLDHQAQAFRVRDCVRNLVLKESMATTDLSDLIEQFAAAQISHSHAVKRTRARWSIPFRRDPDFVDRGTILDRVFAKCSRPASSTALVGIGGVGKTQLAIEFAYRTREIAPEKIILWVHASNVGRFEQGYRQIADQLEIPGRGNSEQNILMLVGSWLSDPENGQWILILDNLDDSDLLDARQAEDSQPLREYLPRSTTGSIFITTRNRQAALKLVEFKDVINVSPMSGNDAEGLLRKKLGVEHDEDDIADLAAELEFMPLAIAQAAAYINQKSPLCSVRQYLDEFQQSDREKMNLLMYDGGQLRRDWDAKNSVFLTWQISFEYIQRNHPSAADLLALMSFFDRQGIPKWLLLKRRIEKAARTSDTNNRNGSGRHSSGVWAKLRRKMKKDSMHPELSSEETLAQGNQKEKDVPLDDDIQVLRDHSFVSVITDDLTFEMHRLVQLATQRWLEVHDQVEYWNAVFTMNLNSCTLDSEYADNCDQCRLLYLHSKAAMENPPGTEDALDRWESSMASAAHYAFQRGQWVDANAFALNGVQVTASRLGADHFITLKALLHSGSVLASTRHPDAEAMQKKALEGFTRTCGEDDQYTLRSMHELGYVYEAAEKWEKAEQMQLRVLRGFKKLLGEEHRDTLECMVRLAWIYNSQGRLEEAEALQVRIANAHQKMFGGQHPQYLHSMAMLALTYRKQKRYMEAETLLVEAGEISKRVLGEQNPETLRCLENLGVIYESQQRFDEAEKVYMEVLNAKKVTFGEDHWDTMVTWANLSSLYTEEGRLEEADDARVRTLKIRKKVIGRDNLDAMLDLHFLAIIRMRRGYITNAMDLMSQCLSRMYQNLGPEHEWTVVTERYVRDWEAEHLERGNATRDELHM